MKDEKEGDPGPDQSNLDIATITDRIMTELSCQFPVCMASDEFHFFPQARSDHTDWSRWDDFSPESIDELESHTGQWLSALADYCHSDPATVIDAGLLRRVLQTLVEQMTLFSPQHTQPTFYLTIMGIGLSEAIDHGPKAWGARLKGLPNFIRQACGNLQNAPQRFRLMGLEMLIRQKDWLKALAPPKELLQPVLGALSELETTLSATKGGPTYLPDVSIFEHIASAHIGCRLKPDDLADDIDQELDETLEILAKAAERLAPGQPWQKVVDGLPRPEMPTGGAPEVYRQTIGQLSRHCVKQGLLVSEEASAWPVKVELIPDYMRPVRSNAAFSAPPGHPPRGGIFYIRSTDNGNPLPSDYRLLAAHETYPGHHLLDSRRWNHKRITRRHIEFPIFYEGWASFSEELMFETGCFKGLRDQMLLAKRRFWRAMRGRADLEIHTRKSTPDEAAERLFRSGMAPDRARAMVRRYVLKPGYQLSYTIGRRRFRHIFERYSRSGGDAAEFARRVLAQGEIEFETLAQLLLQGG